MKRKIKLTDNKTGKVIEGEVTLRNKEHFETQLHTKPAIFKPKKGKGSFKRDKRVDED